MQAIPHHVRSFMWFSQGLVGRYWRVFLSSFVIGLLLVLLSIRLYPTISSTTLFRRPAVIGLVGSFTPTTLPGPIQNLLSVGLVGVAGNGEPTPGVASSWEWGDAGKKLTFHLKEHITWHDGKELTAHDINYQLRDVLFTVRDAKTLEITLKEPFASLPLLLSKPLFRAGLVGVGSYKVSAIKLRGDRVAFLNLVPVNSESGFKSITIKFYPTEEAAQTAFALGEVTTLDEISSVDQMQRWPTISIKKQVKYNRYVGVFFNMKDSLLKEKNLRQALSLATERPAENSVVTPLSSKSWAYTTKVKTYDIDVAAAQKLLDKTVSGTQSAELTLSTVPTYSNLAYQIAEEWNHLKGLKVKVKIETGIPSNFQLLLASQEIPPDPDQYPFWHSTQTGTNITHFVNVKIDKLLEDGRQELDVEKRKRIYFDFQRNLLEDPPAIFLFHPVVYTISRD